MGNIISDKINDDYLNLSNGGTSVLIELLLLAGSDLANTLWEKELMVWFAEKDQTFRGIGCVGFDISEIGWTKGYFEQEKEFVIKVINAAINKTNWHKLNYIPHEGIAIENLDRFKNMIENYKPDFNNITPREWYSSSPPYADFSKCPKHQILLYYLESFEEKCCVICNNATAGPSSNS